MTTMRVVTVSVMAVLVLALRRATTVSRAEAPAFVAVGILDVGANLAFGAATTLGLLSLVSVFGSLYPVATILLARWVDGERLRPIQQVGVALALGGAAAISAG
jgi:drug/metabolite transporter (DMT)-like permease